MFSVIMIFAFWGGFLLIKMCASFSHHDNILKKGKVSFGDKTSVHCCTAKYIIHF